MFPVLQTSNLQGRDDLLRLWLVQRGICPICHQKITKQTGWHSHHVVWNAHGGQDGLENRVRLHRNCHNRVHAQGLQAVKPRPKWTFEMLERYAVKIGRTVLRVGSGGNITFLPDYSIFTLRNQEVIDA